MKYIKLYEAFDSNAISGVLKYIKRKIGNEQSNNFLLGLRKILEDYDYPIDKISNDNVRYLSAKKALPIKSSNDSRIYCLKFWFSLDKGYIGYTGVGDRVMSKSKFSGIESSSRVSDTITSDVVDYIKNTLNIKTGKMQRVTDYNNLQHGDVVIGLFGDGFDLNLVSKAKIFKDENRLYAIQDVASGGQPYYGTIDELGDWRVWGDYSWSLGYGNSPADDHKYLYKYTESDTPLDINDYIDSGVEENHYLYNLPINRYGTLMDWSRYKDENTSIYNKSWKDIEDADFCIVIYLDNMLKSEFKTTTKKSAERKELRKGATSLMSDEELRSAKIDRYKGLLLNKMGVSVDSLDLKNLQKYISVNILGDYSYFAINRNLPELNQIRKFAGRILELIKVIKKEYQKDELQEYYDRVLSQYKNDVSTSDLYKGICDKNYQIYVKNLDKINNQEIKEIIREFLKTCKDIGSDINTYISNQDINSIDEYIFLYNKIKSIQAVMWDDNFKNISVLTKHIINNLSNNDDISNVINYINNMSVSQIDELKNDMERLNKIKSYIKSISK